MCIIVDINTLASVFKTSSADHGQFAPVLSHIRSRKSNLIIGGSKFEAELKLNKEFYKILSIMKSNGQAVEADRSRVDSLEASIAAKFSDPLFNDKHIVALCYISNARLVCTKDLVLQSYIKKRDFYNKGKTPAKVFNSKSPAKIVPGGSFKPKCGLC
ncbi:MAG TPA: hypothetical protein VFH06_03055 [Candidatus Saccharimonadales bacterium]|nr:hypothetical protein [Candidatus Saccharimonadales bacterium]